MVDYLEGLKAIKKNLEEEAAKGGQKEENKAPESEQKEQGIDEPEQDGTQDEPGDDEDAEQVEEQAEGEEQESGQDGESEEERRQRMIRTRQAAKREKDKADRKKLEDDLAAERVARAKDREELARLEGYRDATKKPEPVAKDNDPEPDQALYPEDWNAWDNRQIKKRLDKQDEQLRQAENQRQLDNFKNLIRTAEDEYATKNPDAKYKEAADYLFDMNVKLKMASNPNMTEAQAKMETEQQKFQLFHQMAKANQNPMEAIVRIAQVQGFKPAAGKEPTPKPAVNLEKLADNQRRSANLMGPSPASKGQGKITSEQLLRMSVGDQAKLKAKDPSVFQKVVERHS